MFSSGYGRAGSSTNPFEDDDEPSGGMLGENNDSLKASGTSSGFGSNSGNRIAGQGDPFGNRVMNDKDAWVQGRDDVHDPFANKSSPGPKKSGSILGSLSPFSKSESQRPPAESPMLQQDSSEADRTSFGEFNAAAPATSAPPPAINLPGPIPNYYASPVESGETPIFTCVSCYNRMSKSLATCKLKLEPNTGQANATVSSTTNCDVCQHNLKQLRDQMLAGGGLPPQPMGGISSSPTAGAFPRPNEEVIAAQRGSMGDGRLSLGSGNFDNRGSIESRGSDDLTAGMIRMQNNPQPGQKAGIFSGMFGGTKGNNAKSY